MKKLSKNDFKKALRKKGVLLSKNLELLSILNDAISVGATAKEISNIFGYSDFPPVNSMIGKLGKRIVKIKIRKVGVRRGRLSGPSFKPN